MRAQNIEACVHARPVTAPAENGLPLLTPGEYNEIRRFAYEHFGLDLSTDKHELVSSRLGGRVRKAGCGSYHDYLRSAIADPTGHALGELVDALTTNYTSFLRERAHFEFLVNTVIGEAPAGASGGLRVWSAACSTGEEPYTIGAALCAEARLPLPQFSILATDISGRVLERARRAIYPAAALAAMPEHWLKAAFLRGQGRSEGWMRVRPDLAARIEFRHFNLMQSFPIETRWNVIFCRNVMIYFDKVTQSRVVKRLASALLPGGYLFTGHSESLTGIDHRLEYVRPAIYRKPLYGSADGERRRP